MDLYVITRNIQLFREGRVGGIFGGCCYLLHLHLERGCAAMVLLPGVLRLPAPTPRRGGSSHPVPQHRAGEGTHLPGAPTSRETPLPGAPSRTPRVLLQGKPRRWLLGSHRDMAFRTEDVAGKVNFGLTSLPSGRGPRVGIFPAILLFLVLFFSDWNLFAR